MLTVKPYENLEVENPKLPPDRLRVQKWHGYYHPPEVPWHDIPNPSEYEYLELMGFLSILEYYNGRHFNFVELGAGIGQWCITLAAILEYGIIPKRPISYRALAVEADDTHYALALECLALQHINATVVHKAVTNIFGTGLFSTENPYQRWGQHLLHNYSDDAKKVETTTVDILLDTHLFYDVQLVHMDVQAEEVNVIKGARNAIRDRRIEHFLIEVHDRQGSWILGDSLKALLSPSYNLIVDLPRYTSVRFDNFPDEIWGDAGIQIWQLKDL